MTDPEPWLEAEEVRFRTQRCRGLRIAAAAAVLSSVAYAALSLALTEPKLLPWLLFGGGMMATVLLGLVGSFLADARRETLMVGVALTPAVGLVAVLLPLPVWLSDGMGSQHSTLTFVWGTTLCMMVGSQGDTLRRMFREMAIMPPVASATPDLDPVGWTTRPEQQAAAARKLAATPYRPRAEVSAWDRGVASVLGTLLTLALTLSVGSELFLAPVFHYQPVVYFGVVDLFTAATVTGLWMHRPFRRLLAAGMNFWFGFSAFLSMPLLLLGATAMLGDRQLVYGAGLLVGAGVTGWLGLKTIRVMIDVIEGTVRGEADAQHWVARQAAAAERAADAEAEALSGGNMAGWDQADGRTTGKTDGDGA